MLDFEQITGRLRRSTVQVLPGGSGVVWDATGLIVTNAHVTAGNNVAIVDASGARSHARVILRDSERDLALLEAVPATSGLPAEIGDSNSLRAGQLVLALGNPLGVAGAVAAGVIHSVARNRDSQNRQRWIQADVRLAPGNSGGMLADAAGRLVGITTMIFNGLALAVPVNDVETFVRGLYLKRTA
jgi:serine protease Do